MATPFPGGENIHPLLSRYSMSRRRFFPKQAEFPDFGREIAPRGRAARSGW
jgi:hypothetical protein